MNGGIDHKAFQAELRAMEPEARSRRRDEFVQWLREASAVNGRRANVGIFFVCAAPLTAGFAFELRPHLMPVAIAFLAVGTWLNMATARRSLEWRRDHPFEHWRAMR